MNTPFLIQLVPKNPTEYKNTYKFERKGFKTAINLREHSSWLHTSVNQIQMQDGTEIPRNNSVMGPTPGQHPRSEFHWNILPSCSLFILFLAYRLTVLIARHFLVVILKKVEFNVEK